MRSEDFSNVSPGRTSRSAAYEKCIDWYVELLVLLTRPLGSPTLKSLSRLRPRTYEPFLSTMPDK